ncbi:MAG: hypothetical protein K0S07_368 [Chlamydiales bacterium]|nr:hypothetical protein [Chlamydiales bacterium]
MLFPLTFPYFDRQGFQIQLWRYKNSLIASVMSSAGNLKILNGSKIHNSLSPHENPLHLLARLEKVGKKRWQFAYFPKTDQLYLWPHLVAAGTEDSPKAHIDPATTYSGKSSIPILDKKIHQIGDHFNKHGRDMGYSSKKEYSADAIAFAKQYQNHPEAEILEGKLNQRDPLKPPVYQRVISYGGRSAVISTETGQLINFYQDDGSGHKALVEHKIVREGDGTFSKGPAWAPQKPSNPSPSTFKGQYPPGNHLIDLARRADLVAKRRFKKDDPPPGSGNGGNNPRDPSDGPDDLVKQFQRVFKAAHGKFQTRFFSETLKQNGLLTSYNSSNPSKPMKDHGGSGGSIGGVGMDSGFIQGLFDEYQDLETTHHFFLPSAGSEQPFEQAELRQILRELAVGIYVHDTVPFFSLHFNADSDMYPVIHPAYQNTLVGRVISLLDYYMKGFLNGAFFDEAYVKQWQHQQTHDKDELKKHCISIAAYCQEHLPGSSYLSVRELVDLAKEKHISEEIKRAGQLIGLDPDKYRHLARQFFQEYQIRSQDEISKNDSRELNLRILEAINNESPILSDYSGFRSSFRIIAKQNSFKKIGPLFSIDADFDVFYTMEPDEDYLRELQKYRATYNKDPEGYKRLVEAYEEMRRQIYQLMPQLPVFKELFNQLKVINFFCHYFKTLKKAQKVPLLQKEPVDPTLTCQYLFPPLPIQKTKKVPIKIKFRDIFNCLSEPEKNALIAYAVGKEIETNDRLPSELYQFIKPHLKLPLKLQQGVEFTSYLKDELYRYKIHDFIKTIRAKLPQEGLSVNYRGIFIEQLQDIYKNRMKEINLLIPQMKAIVAEQKQRLKEMGKRHESLQKRASQRVGSAGSFESIWSRFKRTWDVRDLLTDTIVLLPLEHALVFYETKRKEAAIRQLPKEKRITALLSERSLSWEEKLSSLEKELQELQEKNIYLSQNAATAYIDQLLQQLYGAFFEYTPLEFEDIGSHIEFVAEQSESEQQQNRRISGGCGLKMKTQAICFDPNGKAILDQATLKLKGVAEETLQPITPHAKEGGGSVFKLSFKDFYAVKNRDYGWMPLLLTPESLEQSLAHLALFTFIQEDDREAFKFSLANLKGNGTITDSNGTSLIHYAAAAKSGFYLQELMAYQADLAFADPNGLTPLHYAARAGAIENLQEIARLAPHTIHQRAKNGSTPLYLAAQHNQLAAAKILLNLGADAAIPTLYGMTPLYTALQHRFSDMVNLLLPYSYNIINHPLEDGSTPLHLAVEMQESEFVSQLLSAGASRSSRKKNGYLPLHLAVQNGSYEICALLLDAFFNEVNTPLKSGQLAIHLAASRNHSSIVLLLLEKGSHFVLEEEDKQAALEAAESAGDMKEVKNVKRYTAKESALVTAIDSGSVETAAMLIDYISQASPWSGYFRFLDDANENGLTPLQAAFQRRQPILAEKLLEARAYPLPPFDHLIALCQTHMDPLLIQKWISSHSFNQEELVQAFAAASQAGHGQMVTLFQVIFSLSSLSNLKDDWTTEHFAARFDQTGAIERFVLGAGDELKHLALTIDGKTAAAVAAEYDSSKSLKIFLKFLQARGISLEGQYRGSHLLLAAIEGGSLSCADLIIHEMDKVNQPLDQMGRTAAHYAAMYGDVEMLDLLRSRGIDFQLKDRSGMSAIGYAFDYQWKEAVQYFLRDELEIQLPADLLCIVAAKGSEQQMQQVCAKGLAIDTCDAQKRSPLFHAIEKGNEKTFHFLLNKGASLTIQDQQGLTPMLLAAKLGKTHFLKALFNPHLAGQKDEEGNDALQLAARYGHESSVRYLSKRMKGSVNKQNKTAIELLRENQFNYLLPLLEGAPHQLKELKKALVEAIRSGDQATFYKYLPKEQVPSPLVFKIKGQKVTLPIIHLIYLLNQQSTDKEKGQALFKSFVKKYPQAILDRDLEGNTIFHLQAIQGEDVAEVDVLTIGKKGKTILHALAASDKLGNRLEQALQNCTTVDVQDDEGFSPLHDATINGNENGVSLLLKKGANPNLMSKARLSPLMLAIAKGSLWMIRELLNFGANPNLSGGTEKQSCLHLAVMKKELGLVKALLDHQASPTKANAQGENPLHLALKFGDLPIAQLLHASGASLHSKSQSGLTAAHYAVLSGNPQMIEWLCSHDVPLDKAEKPYSSVRDPKLIRDGKAPLHYAILRQDTAMIQKLVEKGCDLEASYKEMNALGFASLYGNKNTWQFFANTRLTMPDEQHLTAIQFALMTDDSDKLALLYAEDDRGDMQIGERGSTALHLAAKNGSLRCLNFLLLREGNWQKEDDNGKTALEVAIEKGQLATVHYFMQHIPQQQLKKTKLGQPLLHYALGQRQSQIASLLIQEGFDVNEKDAAGQTPLQLALKAKQLPLVHLLLAAGSNPSQALQKELIAQLPGSEALIQKYLKAKIEAERNEDSLLHTAVRLNDEQHVPLLVRLANIDYQNKEGFTALHLAVLGGKLNFVQALLAANADLEVMDHHKQTALSLALTKSPNLAIAKRLVQAQANLNLSDDQGKPILLAIGYLPSREAPRRLLFDLVAQSIKVQELSEPTQDMLKAIEKKDFELFMRCVQQGHPLQTGTTSLLHYAVAKDASKIVKVLLEWFRVDVNSKNSLGEDPLSLARQAGLKNMALYLEKKGARVDELAKTRLPAS